MENTIQQKENLIPEPISKQNEFLMPKTVAVKRLKDWGYEEAGLNQGDPLAFENRLRLIKAGHIVDESYDVDEELRRKKQLEDQISEKVTEKNANEKDQQYTKEVII